MRKCEVEPPTWSNSGFGNVENLGNTHRGQEFAYLPYDGKLGDLNGDNWQTRYRSGEVIGDDIFIFDYPSVLGDWGNLCRLGSCPPQLGMAGGCDRPTEETEPRADVIE